MINLSQPMGHFFVDEFKGRRDLREYVQHRRHPITGEQVGIETHFLVRLSEMEQETLPDLGPATAPLPLLKTLRRMWVNQPSTLQPCHKYHGTRVLAFEEYPGTYRVHFLDGPVVSSQMFGHCLSEGWPERN